MTHSRHAALDFHRVIGEMLESDLSPGDSVRFEVVSNSMQPIMKRGDGIIVEIAALPEISRGDIVLIQRESDYLTHRLIRKADQ